MREGYPQPPGERGPVPVQGMEHGAVAAEDLFCVLVRDLTGRRQLNSVEGADQQGLPQLLFQALDAAAETLL